MPKLTKRVVESVVPDKTDVYVRDSEIKGFLCKVTPRGKRVYMLYYRTREGRERKPAIGEHGKLTCDEARDIAKKWSAEVLHGGDPSNDRQQARKVIAIEELSKVYLERHASTLKPRSLEEDRRIWEKYIVPALRSARINAITRYDVDRLHQGLKKTPYMANRVLELLRRSLNLAAEWGYPSSPDNPCKYVKKFKEQARERFLSSGELARLGDILRQCDNEGIELPSVLLAIRLLIFTGCRRNEILELQWDWIDFEQQKIDFPDSKTGKKSIYINPPAIELLRNAKRIPGNPHVCTGSGTTGHLINIQKPWQRILRYAEVMRLIECVADQKKWKKDMLQKTQIEVKKDIKAALARWKAEANRLKVDVGVSMENIRLHDLRHSFASVGAAGGLGLFVIGKLLGHKESSTTERYSHLVGDPLREATNLIGARIAAAMGGGQAEIINIKVKNHGNA